MGITMETTCLYEAESPEIAEGLKALTFSKDASAILKPNPIS